MEPLGGGSLAALGVPWTCAAIAATAVCSGAARLGSGMRIARLEARGDVYGADGRPAFAADATVRRAGGLGVFDGGECGFVPPQRQRQRGSGLGVEQVVTAAESGLLSNPGAMAGDVLRVEVGRKAMVLCETGDHGGLLVHVASITAAERPLDRRPPCTAPCTCADRCGASGGGGNWSWWTC